HPDRLAELLDGQQRPLALVLGEGARRLVGQLAVHPVGDVLERLELYIRRDRPRAIQADADQGQSDQIAVRQALNVPTRGSIWPLRLLDNPGRLVQVARPGQDLADLLADATLRPAARVRALALLPASRKPGLGDVWIRHAGVLQP